MIRNVATFFAVLLMAASSHASTLYPDAIGDTFTNAGGGILDITSVEVSNDATDVSFTFNLAGDPVATDWGKYMVGISKNNGTGDTAGNGWGRPISMNPAGMNYWIGSWVDSGNGAELYTWGSGPGPWSLTEATYNAPPNNLISISKNSSSVTVKVPLSKLGLVAGNSFYFDAFTSGGGGGDGAVDALSSSVPSIADWGNPFNSPGNTGLGVYTVVPEPVSLALIGLGVLTAGMGCVRRRR